MNNDDKVVEELINETILPEQASEPSAPGKKRKRRIIIPIILILVIALAGAIGYYFMERQKPVDTVTDYLTCVKNLDIQGMTQLLQSNDLTALDEDIIRSPQFEEFFKDINSKMDFKIKKVSFDLSNGTADVTAHIKYVNAENIYKEAISECLRQIAISALNGTTNASGEDLLSKPIESQLAPLLLETAANMEEQYAETDITYPVIKTTDGWKVMSLDPETTSIISADFSNVKQEIENNLVNMSPTTSEGTVDANTNGIISINNENFSVKYTQVRISKDLDGKPCLEYYYDYTNNRTEPSGPMYDLSLSATQDGVKLEAAIPENLEESYSNYFSEVPSGKTVNVCQVFALNSGADVTIQASAAFTLDDSVSVQIVKAQ